MWRYLWLFAFLTPQLATAAVTISEVAWMGSTVSANHEWIELTNDGSAVDVTGWTLSDGMNLSIELEGVIPAGGIVVLERTSDDSAPGPAFLIYTGALVNTGATLTLRRADGGLEDQVAGGENWQNIGGDNTTKETAQYAPSGWFTAPPTPGKPGSPSSATPPATDEDGSKKPASQTARTTRSSDSQPLLLVLPDVTLTLAVIAPEVAYVNQSVPFAVAPSGIGSTLIDSLQYQWNFGDTFTASGRAPEHRFLHPGTYVVTVYGSYKRQEHVARHEITVLPLSVSLTMNRSGDVQVNNDSPYEIDLSGYRLVGEREVVFPEYSVLLPNQTVTVSRARLGNTNERMLALYDETDVLVVSRLPASGAWSEVADETLSPSARRTVAEAAPSPRISATAASRVSAPVTFEEPPAVEREVSAERPLMSRSQSAAVGEVPSATTFLDDRRAYTLLAVILLLVVLGVYLSPRRNETS